MFKYKGQPTIVFLGAHIFYLYFLIFAQLVIKNDLIIQKNIKVSEIKVSKLYIYTIRNCIGVFCVNIYLHGNKKKTIRRTMNEQK